MPPSLCFRLCRAVVGDLWSRWRSDRVGTPSLNKWSGSQPCFPACDCPPSKGILRSKYPPQSEVRAPVRGGVRVGHHPGPRGLEPRFESPFSEQNVSSILGSVSGCPRRKEHALSAWQVSPSWYGLGLSAQTAHFGRRGQDPHPYQSVRQREKHSERKDRIPEKVAFSPVRFGFDFCTR